LMAVHWAKMKADCLGTRMVEQWVAGWDSSSAAQRDFRWAAWTASLRVAMKE